MSATDFATRRTVLTGSWLGRRYQRQGVGPEMRAAVLFLAFEGLGALAAESGALEGNDASTRVSIKIGYRPNGERLVAPRGVPIEHLYRVTRTDWRRDLFPVAIENLDACLGMFAVGRWASHHGRSQPRQRLVPTPAGRAELGPRRLSDADRQLERAGATPLAPTIRTRRPPSIW